MSINSHGAKAREAIMNQEELPESKPRYYIRIAIFWGGLGLFGFSYACAIFLRAGLDRYDELKRKFPIRR